MPIESAIHQKYGTAEGVSTANAGMYCTYGPTQVYEYKINLAELTETEAVMNDVLIIPDNAFIEQVEVITLVAATLGTSIDVGLLHISRDTSDAEFTADPNAILDAFLLASMDTIGQKVTAIESGTEDTAVVVGTTTATEFGVLVGDVTTAPTVLTASRTDSTAFGAGKILLRLYVRPTALSAF
jgi:hypothetical protein